MSNRKDYGYCSICDEYGIKCTGCGLVTCWDCEVRHVTHSLEGGKYNLVVWCSEECSEKNKIK